MAHTQSPATPGPGGFLPDTGLPSPTPSQASPLHSRAPGLPHPRSHPLRPGSAKEDLIRRYVEDRIAHINRRYFKKLERPRPGDDVSGYQSIVELCRDVEDLLNVLWLSGTPSMQVPYLLSMAGDFATWVDGFPLSARAMFSVLRKLDYCFASLLAGEDITTKDVLPGFEQGLHAGMTRTDMVRCRSIAELTRVTVVEVMRRGPDVGDSASWQQSRSRSGSLSSDSRSGSSSSSGEEDETEDDDHAYSEQQRDEDQQIEPEEDQQEEAEEEMLDDEEEELHMDAGRVYELTLVKLGEALGDGGGRIGEMVLDDDY